MTVGVMLKVFSGLLTPLIGVVTVYIAWQQWLTNRQKLVLDRYDRRLRVYQEVMKIIGLIVRDAKAAPDDLLQFRAKVAEADFLFGLEVMQYIDLLYKRGLHLWARSTEYRDFTQAHPPGYDHQKVVDEMQSHLVWFTEQVGAAKEIFRKYLDVSK